MGRWKWGVGAVAAIVVVATTTRALAASAIDVPWIVPDEFLYAALGKSLWSDGQLAIRDEPVPFYTALVPLISGWPFAAFGTARAIEVTQWLNALLISTTAIPVYLWTRSLSNRPWAIVAAALTVAAPGFLYSGLIMSEALFVPICVLGLWSLANLLERPSLLAAGVFVGLVTLACAVRLQALIFLPVAIGAALLLAIALRSTTVLRRLAPIALVGIGVGLVTIATVVIGGGTLSWGNALGAYADVAESRPIESSVVSGVAWQTVALAFGLLVVPLAALMALAWAVVTRRPEVEGMAPFTAVAVAWTVLVVVQSALFATAYTGTAAGRYLVTASPLMAIALCAWCARGGPCRLVAAVTSLAAAALALFVPLDTIAGADAFSANPFAAPLTWLVEDGHLALARTLLVGVALAAALVLALVSGRRLRFVVVVVAVSLVAVSASAYVRAAKAASAERLSTVGEGDRAWIDSAVGGEPVAMLATGAELWTGATRTLFWNPSVRRVLALPAARSKPLVATPADISDDGTLTVTGPRLPSGLVVTPSTVQLDGELVATSPGRGSATYPWRLWRASTPIRVVSYAALGVDPVGDMTGHAQIIVPGCRPGALWVTFIGKTDVEITAFLDGTFQRTVQLQPGETPTESFPAPSTADGSKPCVYDLDVPTLTGSTRLEFVPDG